MSPLKKSSVVTVSLEARYTRAPVREHSNSNVSFKDNAYQKAWYNGPDTPLCINRNDKYEIRREEKIATHPTPGRSLMTFISKSLRSLASPTPERSRI